MAVCVLTDTAVQTHARSEPWTGCPARLDVNTDLHRALLCAPLAVLDGLILLCVQVGLSPFGFNKYGVFGT